MQHVGRLRLAHVMDCFIEGSKSMKFNKSHKMILRVAISSTLLVSPFSVGQDSESRGGLEEVIVTAQKRVESLQDVPISVSALSGDQMDRMHATTLESLQGYIPNLQVHSFANVSHGSAFNIRGMGVIEPDPNGGTTVVIVEDGVPQFFNMTSFLDTFDTERVEVLRGPQGTLFGANATGGVIQVVNVAPSGELGAKVDIGIGNYDLTEMKAAVEFPITDQLSARVTATSEDREGYVTNIVDGSTLGSRDRSGIRGQLAFDNDNGFTARLIASVVRHRDGPQDTVSGSLPGEITYVAPVTEFPSEGQPNASFAPMYQQPCVQANVRCEAPDKYLSANSDINGVSDMDTHAATLHMSWETGFGDVTSITGFKDFELHDLNDQDFTPAFVDDTDRLTTGEQFSQELRLNMDLSDKFTLMVGGFYADYSYDHYQDFRIGWVPGFRQLTEYGGSTETYSFFAQTYFDLSDRLRLQAGLRYTSEEQDFYTTVSNFFGTRGYAEEFQGEGSNRTPGTYEVFVGDVPVKKGESWNNVGGKLGLDFQVNEDVMVYGSYARGFKSGGFVGRIVIPEDSGPFDEEYVDTYEVGIKTELLDRSLRLNVAAFFNQYDDMQLANIYFTEDALGNTVNGNTILNAANAETSGMELDILWMPTDNLRINAALGLLDAEYKEFLYGADQIDLSGQVLQNAPETTANLGLQYTAQIQHLELSTSIQYKYVSKKWDGNIVNSPRSEVQPTNLVDVNVDLSDPNSNWSLGIWAMNITDERYISNSFVAAGVVGLVDYQPPRTYGMTLSLRF